MYLKISLISLYPFSLFIITGLTEIVKLADESATPRCLTSRLPRTRNVDSCYLNVTLHGITRIFRFRSIGVKTKT